MPRFVCRYCEKKMGEVPVDIQTNGRDILTVCDKCRKKDRQETEELLIAEFANSREFLRSIFEWHVTGFKRVINALPKTTPSVSVGRNHSRFQKR